MLTRIRWLLVALCILNLAGAGTAQSIWTGNGLDNNWTTAANWSGGTPASGAAATITFASPFRLAPIQNIANPFALNQLTFGPSAGTFTLGGNGLNFVTGGSGPPSLTQSGGNAQTIAVPVTLTNDLTVTNTIIGTGGLTLSGAVTGAGSLTMTGGYTLTLSGAGSSFNGGLNVNGGTVKLGANNVLTAASPSVSVGGGTFSLNGFNQTIGDLTLNGNPAAAPTASTGTGTLTLGGNVTYNGGAGARAGSVTGNVVVGGAGCTMSITSISGESYDLVISAPIGGSGGIAVDGVSNGLVALTAANSYSGPTTVNHGTLLLGATNGLPTATAINLTTSTANLNLNPLTTALGVTAGSYSQSVGSLAGVAGSTVNLGTATLTIGTVGMDGPDMAFAGNLIGGTLVKTGNGTLTLSGLNNTSNLIVQQSYLRVSDMASNGGVGALGTGAVTLEKSSLSYTGPTATSTKPIALGGLVGVVQVTTPGANLTLNGVLSGANLLVYGPDLGPGISSTLTLGAKNTYTGWTTVVYGAILAVPAITDGGVAGPIGASSNLPTNLRLANADRGTLLLTGTNSTYSTDRGITVGGDPFSAGLTGGTGGVVAVQNAGTSLTVSGQIVGSGYNEGSIGILVKAGAGVLILTNSTNNYANPSSGGGTSVEEGTLTVGAAGAVLPIGTPVVVAAGAVLNVGFTAGSNSASPIGTLTLNGGTLRIAGGHPNYYLNQLIISPTGGSLDFTGTTAGGGLNLVNAGASISITANSTWSGGGVTSVIGTLASAGLVPFTIAPGITLANSIPLASSGLGYRVSGGGTLYQTAPANAYILNMIVSGARVRVDDLSVVAGASTLGYVGAGPTLTLDNGTLQYAGPTQSTVYPFALGAGGGTVDVSSAATSLTLTGTIAGTDTTPLVKAGPGTLILGTTSPSFGAGIVVNGGVVGVFADAQLGAATVTVNPAGTLRYLGTTSAARTINLNGGKLEAAAGVTLTLNGAAVNGGFMRGAGTIALTGGTVLSGVTTLNSATVIQTGQATYVDFSNGGNLAIAAGMSTPTAFDGFTNQGSGAITVGAASPVSVSDFQSYGSIAINQGADVNHVTLLTNAGTSPMFFNGGSRTFIGVPLAAGQFSNAAVDLNGKNAVVAGGLFVNNGYVVDSVNGGAGTATIIADFGALVKGAGFFQNPVVTQNGGRFQAGNSPGSATFGKFVLGPGGVDHYVFAIDDATGTAGPSPDALGHVSGWGLVKTVQRGSSLSLSYSGDFTWTATPSDKLILALDTLVNPTTVGIDIAGPMADFDLSLAYTWTAIQWAGTFSGPADAAALNGSTSFDLSGFVNPFHGTFGWVISNSSLSLSYTPTPVPEPGTLVLVGAAAVAAAWRQCRRRMPLMNSSQP